uniref:Cysteine sulfinic acid decarboxylase n=1 Tax=Varanus komodoensis TaxID=61221 RepID=A0A8D2JG01_VARKO
MLREPEELQQILDLDLKDCGEPQEKLLKRCRNVIRYSVKTCHPRFFNQLFSGLDHHALAGRLITEMLNTSQYTYEIAPVFVLMEEVVLKKLRELIGWKKGDGIFCPGGSISNMYAMNVARFHCFPDCKQKGNWAIPKLAAFTSQEVCSPFKKGAAFLGIGTDNVYLVAVDENHMAPVIVLLAHYENIFSPPMPVLVVLPFQGALPFFVNATCGTTVLGAFDPVAKIAEVCARHRVWLHVDVMARLFFCFPHRADSVAWNPHKMLMTGLQCSAFLLQDSSGLLQRCHCAKATYLFQTDKFYDMAYDKGDQTIQCGRKVDCFKLWLMWKANGTKGLEQRVDRAFSFTRCALGCKSGANGPEFINLCFWYVPPSLRGQEGCTDYSLRLGKVAPVIKEQMMKKGSMMVGYQPHGDRVNFFRQVVTNPAVTREDLNFFLDEIERLGRDL